MTKLILFIIVFTILVSAIFFVLFFNNKTKNIFKYSTRQRLEPYVFILPVFILLLLMFGYPIINSFVMAFQKYNLMALDKVTFSGLDNFTKLFADRDIGMIFKNTIAYVVSAVSVQFILGLILALALKKDFRGRGLYQSIVFLPWAFSGFVIGIMFRWSFNGEYGVINDLLMKLGMVEEKIAWLGTPGLSLLVVIIAMIWMGIPFFGIMLLAALQSIPTEVYEAAAMDGCGSIRKFTSITLPFIKPTIITTILLRTIWIFNSFDLVVVITEGGPANTSQTIPSFMYSKAFSSYDFGFASALGILIMVALSLYALIFMKASKYNQAGEF